MTDIDNILLHCAHRRTADEPRKILVSMRSPLPSQKSLTSNDKNNFISVDMLQSSQTSFISNTLEEYIFFAHCIEKKTKRTTMSEKKTRTCHISLEWNEHIDRNKEKHIYILISVLGERIRQEGNFYFTFCCTTVLSFRRLNKFESPTEPRDNVLLELALIALKVALRLC